MKRMVDIAAMAEWLGRWVESVKPKVRFSQGSFFWVSLHTFSFTNPLRLRPSPKFSRLRLRLGLDLGLAEFRRSFASLRCDETPLSLNLSLT